MNYYEDIFDEIIDCDNPELIQNVSMLRHYVNCHGKTKKLQEYLKCDKDTIKQICDFCFGNTPIKTLQDDVQKTIEDAKRNREMKEEAEMKNAQLIDQLYDMRQNMCGIGTRRVKLFLNSRIKKNDILAKLYRLALEIEDNNIQAKDNFYYSLHYYNKKEELIKELAQLCVENNYTFGIQNSDVKITNTIIYFELPYCEQISFHCNLSDDIKQKYPPYNKEWDRKVNSTLFKIETAILSQYGKDIHNKYTKCLCHKHNIDIISLS